MASTQRSNLKTSTDQWWQKPQLIALALGVLGLLLYANTFTHSYALDDEIVISKNEYTQAGLDGMGGIFTSDPINVYFKKDKNLVQGGRYRPLSIATFALEVEVFGPDRPGISHVINALIYAGTIYLLFWVLFSLLPAPKTRPLYLTPAFLITLLFAAHPIHTEAVANIKGRDELLALLFGLAAFWAAIRYFDTGKILSLVLIPIWFGLSLLAKESSLPLLLPIPLAFWFFRKTNWLRTGMILGSLVFITVTYIFIRVSLVGPPGGAESAELMNNPFVGMGFGERLANTVHILALYLQKLLVPYPLSHDYYPWAIPQTGWGDWQVWLSLALYIGIIAAATWGFLKKNPLAYGLIFFLSTISIVSNIPFSVGTLMGERFAFIPSLGFLIALVMGLEQVKQIPLRSLHYGFLGLAGIFAVLTLLRNPAWADNYSLFTTDVAHSPGSAKARNSAGGILNEKAMDMSGGQEQQRLYREAEKHLIEAVKIHPSYAQAHLSLGNSRFGLGNYTGALASFETAMSLKPGFADAVNNAAITAAQAQQYAKAGAYYRKLSAFRANDPKVYFDMGLNYEKAPQPDSAIVAYQKAIQLDPQYWQAMGNLSLVYGRQKNDFQNAVRYGEMALSIHPTEEWLYDNTAIAYAMGGNFEASVQVFLRGLQQFPESAKLHLNLGKTYLNLGQQEAGESYVAKAFQLDPNLQP